MSTPACPVVVTGMGFELPGEVHDTSGFWHLIREGKSSLTPLVPLTGTTTPTLMAGQITHEAAFDDVPEHHRTKYSKETLHVLSAVRTALRDSGVRADSNRTSLIASSSRGPLSWWESVGHQHEGITRLMGGLAGTPASLAAIHFGIEGLVTTISTACVGGAHALHIAVQALRAYAADQVVVVGHEFPLCAAVINSLSDPRSRALSLGSTLDTSIRPYDTHRDGTAVGEGVIAMVLERESDARAAQRQSYASLAAVLPINEAHHPTSMDLTGDKTVRLLEESARAAGVTPSEIDYFCGHGTGTIYNDRTETAAVARATGREDAVLTSVKPVFGHLLGASTMVNVAATALMIQNQTVAPTANLAEVSQDCRLDHVPGGARPHQIETALSLTFALGSQSAAVVLAR